MASQHTVLPGREGPGREGPWEPGQDPPEPAARDRGAVAPPHLRPVQGVEAGAGIPPEAAAPIRRGRARHDRIALAVTAIVAGIDVAAIGLAMVVALSFSAAAFGYALATVVVLVASGRWKVHLTLQALEGAPRLVAKLAVPLLVLAPLGLGSVTMPPALFGQAALTPLAVVLGRSLSYGLVRAGRRRGLFVEPVLIIGGGEIAGELARIMTRHREFGLEPVGHLDAGPSTLPIPKLGTIADLGAVLRREPVSRLIVAFSTTREHELVEVLRTAVVHGLTVHIVPRFFDVAPSHAGPDADEIWGIPLYRFRPIAFSTAGWPAKRAFDVVVAAGALAVAAPLMAATAVAVRLSSPGPLLFRQRRVGQFGREIDVLKFRTMTVNSEADTRWGTAGDARMTRVGRLLRRTNLDELPQLWNVLRGDMSLIGPRPERPHFAGQFAAAIPGYSARHRLPVGLTGWAQVNGLRGDTSISERARFDNAYIERWSLWRDLVILLRTVGAVIRKGSD